jgi:hypothetical protein
LLLASSVNAQHLPIASTTTEACHVFKVGQGGFISGSGVIGAGGWIMVFDSATAPSNGAVTPIAWAYASVMGSWSISYNSPAGFVNGLTICASSTGPFTLTQYSTNTVFSAIVQ